MTKEQQIALIHQKCIEANPEIATLRTPCLCINHGKCPFKDHVSVGRPIRLADVLLVLSTPKLFYDLEKYEWVLYGLCSGLFPKSWNLRKDDLTEQSEETLQFIADLLK